MQMHCKSKANAPPIKRGQPERLSLFFSQKSRFSHPIKSPEAKMTGKIINFAIPKHCSDRQKRL